MKCLSIGYFAGIHLLTMQIEPSGTVSRISLIIDNAFDFFPVSDALPSAQWTAAPIAPESMLMRLDRLCESLGHKLRQVVIALFPLREGDLRALQADPVEMMRGLRDQMPSMARWRRLAFRMSRKWHEPLSNSEYDAICKAMFDRKSQYWMNIAPDD